MVSVVVSRRAARKKHLNSKYFRIKTNQLRKAITIYSLWSFSKISYYNNKLITTLLLPKYVECPFFSKFHVFLTRVLGTTNKYLEGDRWRLLGPCVSVLSRFSRIQLTLYDSMDCSPPGSSVHGILEARILDWVTVPSSRPPAHISYVSSLAPGFFSTSTT